MEKVNIKAVFTQFVLAGGLLKSFAISGNETFKTISFTTLKKDKMQSQIKIWLCRKFDCEYDVFTFHPLIMRADVVYRCNDTRPSFILTLLHSLHFTLTSSFT